MNMQLLQQKIDDSGIKIVALADKLGISRGTFYKKMISPETWKVTEMKSLVDILRLSEEDSKAIFDL